MKFLLFLLLPSVLGELLQNGGMESLDHWECWGIKCEITNDHHGGSHAIAVSGRKSNHDGPTQFIPALKSNGRYRVSGWIKLTNDQKRSLGQNVMLMLAVHKNDGSSEYQTLAMHPLARSSDGWIHLNGDFNMPSYGFKSARIYYQGPVPEVDFIADDVSVTEIATNTNWRAESDSVIESKRKGDINVHVYTAPAIDANQVEIDVIQVKKSFPFGTAVVMREYLNGSQVYQDFINKHFNWAVPENALKWKNLEPHKGQSRIDDVIKSIKKLRSHGIKVRGHNLLWSNPNRVPRWVAPLRGDQLRDAVKTHIQETMGKTKGLLENWDVNNENLHYTWFQDTLQDRDYDIEIFRMAHQADPHMPLFLNEFDVVRSGSLTEAFRDQGIRMKNSHVGLGMMGTESHFHDEVAPDPTLIKQHLDTIAEAGVPVWVTEFDVFSNDENKRADWYETALRAFYGHPAVEGILFWGFWDQHHWRGTGASLVSGDDFKINAAGQRVLDLLENQWMTKVYHKKGDSFKVRGFHGDYEVHVKVNGKEVASLKQNFTLNGSTHNVVNVKLHVKHTS